MNLNVFELFTTKLARDDSNEETTVDGSDGSTKQTRGSFLAGMCKECPPNSIINERKTGCTQCQHGQKPNDQGTACVPCPIGTAGTDGTCEPCIKDQTYQNEIGQITCKECSKCDAHYYVSTTCSQSSNTVCSRCNRKIIKRDNEVELEINRYGPPHDACNDNCKVQIYDDLLEQYDDVDIAGKNQHGNVTFTHCLKENEQAHAPNYPGPKIGGLEREGKYYYFWQQAPGNTKWELNIMTNPRKYNPYNNYSTSCMECAVNKRPNMSGTECLNLFEQTDMLDSNKVW